jgi:hypothetical protein
MADVSFFRECAMCGNNAELLYRWYQYDQGEQFKAPVCADCAAVHSSLVKGK